MYSTKMPLLIVLVAGLFGFAFSAVSTSDYAEHLDRQVHSIHCSFVPGLGADASGSSGCHVTMMSPYSAIFRESIWGGIPISLFAMSVFGWIVALALWMLGRPNRAAAKLLLVSTVVPVVASLIMGFIAVTKLHAACKLCIGIYIASAAAFVGAMIVWGRSKRNSEAEAFQTAEPLPEGQSGLWAIATLLFALCLLIPVGIYLWRMPNHSQHIGKCGKLEMKQGMNAVTVGIERGNEATTKVVEVLDPLCPACRAFEERLNASSLRNKLSRRAIMFPLDNTCNWMVDSAVHPGACTISEAVLCAGGDARMVLTWAFENQDEIKRATSFKPSAALNMVRAKFPGLASCVGSPSVRARLNRSLRWAVANHLPVLTPQLYVEERKLCDEDTDLGLEYALAHLIGH